MSPLDHEIRKRAENRCEYCQLPEHISELRHMPDHIIARQHGGKTRLENLALACARCNLHKGPNIAGVDPTTGVLTRLFNPREDRWAEHFRWRKTRLIGLSAIGRTTIVVPAINHPYRVALREANLDL